MRSWLGLKTWVVLHRIEDEAAALPWSVEAVGHDGGKKPMQIFIYLPNVETSYLSRGE